MTESGDGRPAVDGGEGPGQAGATATRRPGSDSGVAHAANPVSAAALARHAQRMRPLRVAYVAVLTVATVVTVALVAFAYQRGEISHVTLRTVPAGLPSLGLQTPATTLSRAWTSTDTTAIGTPYYQGTVVTHDQHTVRGRDARTGRPTWSYTRTDRSVCTAIQDDAVTIAVYRLGGNCDELTALDSATGDRKWNRTLDKDTAVFDGPASYSVRSGNVMFVSATSIYSISPSGDADHGSGGLDHWVFHHPGCTINGAVLGDAGALISQTCVHEDCSGARFCGNGTQLLLRSALTGTDTDSKTNKNNPDQIIWNKLGSDLVPTLADHQVAAREPSGGALQLLAAANGVLEARLPLARSRGSAAPVAATAIRDADLIWIAGRTYALRTDTREFTWQADTDFVPTAIDAGGGAVDPTLAAALLAVPTSSGIAVLDPGTGRPRQRFPVGAQPPGSLAYPLGHGFLVAGPSTTMYS